MSLNRKQRRRNARGRKQGKRSGSDALPQKARRLAATAQALHDSGRARDAVDFLRDECARGNDDPYILSLLGGFEIQSGLVEAGLDHGKKAALKAPDDHTVLSNYGTQLLSQGYASDAIRVLEKALACAPNSSKIWFKLAQALMAGERFADAEMRIRSFIAANPGESSGYALLVDILDRSNRTEEAKAECIQLLDRDPSDVSNHVRYIDLLIAAGEVVKASSHLEELMLAQPSVVDESILAKRLALAALTKGWDAAIDMASDILKHRRGAQGIVRQQRAMQLTAGRFDDGWKTAGQESARLAIFSTLPHRVWHGEKSDERTLLIRGAEGIGDQLLFSQLFPGVADRVKQLVVECDHRLVGLFNRSFPGIEFVGWSNPPQQRLSGADIDLQCLPRDLGRLFLHSFEDFPRPNVNLAASPDGAAATRDLRRRHPGKRLVGLSWRSSSSTEGRGKTVSLLDCAEMLKCPKVQFVNLQYGSTESEIGLVQEKLGIEVVSLDGIDATDDIDDCIGAVSELDLVITVSNVTAHYAGNVGTPVWILVPKSPLWHWFADRSDSPWYPSAKLYRQKPSDNWSPVLAEIARDLKGLAQR